MMLGEPSAPAAYWEQVGRQAIEQGVERTIMMVSGNITLYPLYMVVLISLIVGRPLARRRRSLRSSYESQAFKTARGLGGFS